MRLRGRAIGRRAVAWLAACALLLHAAAMGALAPVPEVRAAVVSIDAAFGLAPCHAADPAAAIDRDRAPGDHSGHGARMAPCALCGAGACGMGAPPALAVPPAAFTVVAVQLRGPDVLLPRSLAGTRFLLPRGPPSA